MVNQWARGSSASRCSCSGVLATFASNHGITSPLSVAISPGSTSLFTYRNGWIGVVGVDVELLDAAGADQGQDDAEEVAGEGGGDADIERRTGGQPGNAGDWIGNDGAGQRQIAGAEGAQVGALHQAILDIDRVVEDTAAATDHGAVVGQAPGEPGRGRETQVSVPLVAQAVGAEDGCQVLRLGEVVVERVAFERPGKTVVESEARVELPGVLPVNVEEAVVVGLAALEGRRLIDVADPEGEGFQGKTKDVSERVERLGDDGREGRRQLEHFLRRE